MKTLEDIKEEYARENNFCEWSEILYSIDDPAEIDEHFDKVANLYALEACKEALRNVSNNVKLGISEYRTRKDGSIGWVVTENQNLFIINDGCNVCATEESILSESNIPQELINTKSNNG